MTTIEKIKGPVAAEFSRFEECYREVFVSTNPVLRAVFEHLMEGKGKQLRPLLLLLTARLCGEPNERTIYSAVVLELLHTVSLIHDDVVDSALVRRGRKSVNGAFGNQVAVLSGDYLLSRCMELCFEKLGEDGESQRVLSQLVGELSDGELWQQYYAERLSWDEGKYFQVIEKKTAALFSTCARVAASTVGAPKEEAERMAQMGKHIGLAFQIRDDVFDYSPEMNVGKPSLHDITEGKITLPLIKALAEASEGERRFVYDFISRKQFTPDNLQRLERIVVAHKGIERASAVIDDYRARALDVLAQYPDSDVRRALVQLLEYVTLRKV